MLIEKQNTMWVKGDGYNARWHMSDCVQPFKNKWAPRCTRRVLLESNVGGKTISKTTPSKHVLCRRCAKLLLAVDYSGDRIYAP